MTDIDDCGEDSIASFVEDKCVVNVDGYVTRDREFPSVDTYGFGAVASSVVLSFVPSSVIDGPDSGVAASLVEDLYATADEAS